MEDAYTAIPFLLEVPVPADCLSQVDILPPRIATQVNLTKNWCGGRQLIKRTCGSCCQKHPPGRQHGIRHCGSCWSGVDRVCWYFRKLCARAALPSQQRSGRAE